MNSSYIMPRIFCQGTKLFLTTKKCKILLGGKESRIQLSVCTILRATLISKLYSRSRQLTQSKISGTRMYLWLICNNCNWMPSPPVILQVTRLWMLHTKMTLKKSYSKTWILHISNPQKQGNSPSSSQPPQRSNTTPPHPGL